MAFSQVTCLEVRFLSVRGVRSRVHVPSRGVSCVVVIIIIVLVPTPTCVHCHLLVQLWVFCSRAWPPGLASPRTAVLTVAACVPFLWRGFLSFNTDQELCHFLILAPRGLPGKGKLSPTAITHCPFAPSTKFCGVPTTCCPPSAASLHVT